MTRPCTYSGDVHLGLPPCSEPAVFDVLRRDFDPFNPGPHNSQDCCREHLAITVELTDEAGPGYVVSVVVIASERDRRAAESAARERTG